MTHDRVLVVLTLLLYIFIGFNLAEAVNGLFTGNVFAVVFNGSVAGCLVYVLLRAER